MLASVFETITFDIRADAAVLAINRPAVLNALNGGSQRLPRLIGKGRAMQIILSGKSIDAAEAWRIGLVNEVVATAQLLDRALDVLKSVTANAPIALRQAIAAINRGLESAQPEGCALEADIFALCAAKADRAEGTAAFLAKRKPAFIGTKGALALHQAAYRGLSVSMR